MTKHLRIVALAVSVVLVFCLMYGELPAGAWGNEGHTMINRVAAMKIPVAASGKGAKPTTGPTMPQFLRDNASRIAYLGPEPDRWRSNTEAPLKWSQEPDHFIDMERIPADFGPLPVDRYLYTRRLYERRAALLAAGTDKKKADELLPEKVGFQPYIVAEIYGRLKVAFREYRRLTSLPKHRPETKLLVKAAEQNAVFYAGWLGHYVADGSQPLHNTVNYDGWVEKENPSGYRTEKGIHWEFEGPYVGRNFTDKDFQDLVGAPAQLKDPFNDYVAYLKESLTLVPKVYELDKQHGFTDKGTPEAKEFTRRRLAAGSQMLLNLWYTAWMESAVPLPERTATAETSADLKKK